MKTTTVAVVQTDTRFGCVERNIEHALSLMKSKRADMYVLPELFATGYNILSTPEIRSMAETADAGPAAQAMQEWARRTGSYVVYGFAEKDGSRLYNSAALVGPRGTIGLYRKIHLFWREKLFFSAGKIPFKAYPLPFGRVGLMICFDWYFPESARRLALEGAQIIAHPSNLVLANCPDGMKTRCLENRVFAATADRVGQEKRGNRLMKFIGMSEIVSPKGKILTRLSTNRPQIGTVRLNLREANDKTASPLNDLFEDRRPVFY